MLMKTEIVPARVSQPSAEPRPRRAGGVEAFPGRVCEGGAPAAPGAPEIWLGSPRASGAQQEPSPPHPMPIPQPRAPQLPPALARRRAASSGLIFPQTPRFLQYMCARGQQAHCTPAPGSPGTGRKGAGKPPLGRVGEEPSNGTQGREGK